MPQRFGWREPISKISLLLHLFHKRCQRESCRVVYTVGHGTGFAQIDFFNRVPIGLSKMHVRFFLPDKITFHIHGL